ncbi:chemotaxis protein CheD [Pseudoduganella ginsengisoli]|uniref:Probable chemoreceptor glutamine deamidase CheD n=1 Tax=Pseudoduganella ginsengisoli TaxID=1462440 RepID=A0A6L6Q2S2_9BURK|nr:chemotaxis protein CheD [Pseudoduganella ginsengisoli]MTW03382.1 hypothetical protein [Pseudoduganella ginsengisoli]
MNTVPAAGCQRVGIGQLKIGASGGQLEAVLGSCVGIALIWKAAGRCGLAHCLLPEAPGQQASAAELAASARYVSVAVPSLLRLMGAHEEDYPDIEAVVAGGASMLDKRSQRLQVGRQNAAAARKYLRERGLHVSATCLGGEYGRTMYVDCATQNVIVRDIVPVQD